MQNQQKEQIQDAIDLIHASKDDLNENTFCFRLFENGLFDAEKFEYLLHHCENLVVMKSSLSRQDFDCLVWVILSVIRAVFYHYSKSDRFYIKNFNGSVEKKWNEVYSERWLNLLERMIAYST